MSFAERIVQEVARRIIGAKFDPQWLRVFPIASSSAALRLSVLCTLVAECHINLHRFECLLLPTSDT